MSVGAGAGRAGNCPDLPSRESSRRRPAAHTSLPLGGCPSDPPSSEIDRQPTRGAPPGWSSPSRLTKPPSTHPNLSGDTRFPYVAAAHLQARLPIVAEVATTRKGGDRMPSTTPASKAPGQRAHGPIVERLVGALRRGTPPCASRPPVRRPAPGRGGAGSWEPMTCDVCRRRLLRGERAALYARGEEQVVACPLCAIELSGAGLRRVPDPADEGDSLDGSTEERVA